jgi:hypothetical protein
MRKPRFRLPNAREINKRFAGKHVAIIDGKVVASGKSPIEVWKRAKKLHPQRKPVLAFVLKDDVIVLNEEAGKVRKSYYGTAGAIGPLKVEYEMKGHDEAWKGLQGEIRRTGKRLPARRVFQELERLETQV